jgi:hypothetical protein
MQIGFLLAAHFARAAIGKMFSSLGGHGEPLFAATNQVF